MFLRVSEGIVQKYIIMILLKLKGIFYRNESLPYDYEPNGLHFVHNQKENCHYDYIPLILKGIKN